MIEATAHGYFQFCLWPIHLWKACPGNVEEEKTAADVFRAAIMDKTDTLSGEGDALAELPHVSCVFPRGRFDLSMYPGFMDMDGQNSQFKIRCVLHIGARGA